MCGAFPSGQIGEPCSNDRSKGAAKSPLLIAYNRLHEGKQKPAVSSGFFYRGGEI